MIMAGAAGVERRGAGGAPVGAGEIVAGPQLPPPRAPQDRGPVPPRDGPHGRRVVGQFVVALAARVIGPAAAHPDGDDIQRAVPVGAARLRIEVDAFDGWTHGTPAAAAPCRERIMKAPHTCLGGAIEPTWAL